MIDGRSSAYTGCFTGLSSATASATDFCLSGHFTAREPMRSPDVNSKFLIARNSDLALIYKTHYFVSQNDEKVAETFVFGKIFNKAL